MFFNPSSISKDKTTTSQQIKFCFRLEKHEANFDFDVAKAKGFTRFDNNESFPSSIFLDELGFRKRVFSLAIYFINNTKTTLKYGDEHHV